MKEVLVKSTTVYLSWILKERDEFAHEEEVCCPTNEGEVVSSFKLDRASGVDSISSTMLKGIYDNTDTNVINESLAEGSVPG